MRIEEAMLLFKQRTGKKFNRAGLAEKLWPESTHGVRKVNLSRLINGHTQRIEINQIRIICEELGVDANYLLNVEPVKF